MLQNGALDFSHAGIVETEENTEIRNYRPTSLESFAQCSGVYSTIICDHWASLIVLNLIRCVDKHINCYSGEFHITLKFLTDIKFNDEFRVDIYIVYRQTKITLYEIK